MKFFFGLGLLFLALYTLISSDGYFGQYRVPAAYRFKKVKKQVLTKQRSNQTESMILDAKTQKNPKFDYGSLSSFVDESLSRHFSDLVPFIGSSCPEAFEDNALYEDDTSLHSLSCQGKEVDINYYEKFRTYQEYVNGRIVEYQGSLEAAEPLRIRFVDPHEFEEISLMINGVVIYSLKFKNNLVYEVFKNIEHIKSLPEEMALFSGFDGFQNRLDFLKQEKNKVSSIISGLCKISQDKKTCAAADDLDQFKFPI